MCAGNGRNKAPTILILLAGGKAKEECVADLRLDYTQNMQQQMRLSPQMIQSISLIAMNAEELSECIREEAEKNPAVEITHKAE